MTLTREDAFELAEHADFSADTVHETLQSLRQCPGIAGDHQDLLDFAGKLRSAAMKLRAYAQDVDQGDTDVEKVARYVRKHCGA